MNRIDGRTGLRLLDHQARWRRGHRAPHAIDWCVGLTHWMRPDEEVALHFTTPTSGAPLLDLRYEASWGFDYGLPYDDAGLPGELERFVAARIRGAALVRDLRTAA